MSDLVETWINSRRRKGRRKQVTTTFEPEWDPEMISAYLDQTDQITKAEFMANMG